MKEKLPRSFSNIRERVHNRMPEIPVEISLGRVKDLSKSHELINTVREFKQEPTYRRLKRQGLQFTPTRISTSGLLVGVVGTAAAIGLGYTWWKHRKENIQEKEQLESSETADVSTTQKSFSQQPLEEGVEVNIQDSDSEVVSIGQIPNNLA